MDEIGWERLRVMRGEKGCRKVGQRGCERVGERGCEKSGRERV